MGGARVYGETNSWRLQREKLGYLYSQGSVTDVPWLYVIDMPYQPLKNPALGDNAGRTRWDLAG